MSAVTAEDLRALLDALPFDLWLRDREQVCVYANPHAAARWPGLVGSTPEMAGGRPEVIAIWRSNNERAMAGEIVRGEVRYEIDGRVGTYVNFIAPVRKDGEIVGTAGINLDVTDLRDREREVERLRALIQGIFEHAPIAIGVRAIRDDDVVHVEDNPKAAELFGLSASALRGKSERTLGLSPEAISRVISRFRESRAAGQPVPHEVTYDSSKGPRTMLGKVAPLPDEGEGERYVFIGEDVTEVRTLEAGLLRADRLASLGTMAAGVAHEINNPLTFVQGHLSLAVQQLEKMTRVDGASAVLSDLRVAAAGVDRIAGLVREMLQLARATPLGPAAARADVRVTIESVLGLAGSRLRAVADVEHVVDEVPAVRADAMKLGQVLLNLLTNAAQAIEARGARGHIWVRAASSNGSVVVRVEDDGPGIPPELREKLFAPFQTTRGEGNGLGLFVCRRLVSEMGGTIDAFARDGGGTEMRIVLPVA
ncbi:MAG: ATP-binding protein [Polyangiales bacterium]